MPKLNDIIFLKDNITERERKARALALEAIIFTMEQIKADVENDYNGDNLRNAQAIRELSEAFANVWRCDYRG